MSAQPRASALPLAEAERLHRAEQRWLDQSAARLRRAVDAGRSRRRPAGPTAAPTSGADR